MKNSSPKQDASKPRNDERRVTICPKCGSGDVSPEKEPAYVASMLSFNFKQCNSCGHHGQVFPEVPLSAVPQKPKKIKQISGKRQLVQTSYGAGILGVIIPFAILINALHLVLFWGQYNLLGRLLFIFILFALSAFFVMRRPPALKE